MANCRDTSEYGPCLWEAGVRFYVIAALLLGLAAAPAWGGVWPTEIDRVARQLESSEVSERRAAAARLASLPARVASSLLSKAIEDPDPEVRLASVAALLAHRLPAPEERVLRWLSEQDARLRLAACQALRSGVSVQGIPSVARALGDADLRVRQAAAVALGNAGVVDGVAALLGHLDDPAPEVRAAVVDALWKLGDDRAVVPLAGKVQDTAPEVRRAVVRALGELGDKRATNALILALRDVGLEVRVDAIGSLGLLGDPAAIPALIPMMEPQQPPVIRRAALESLGRIGTPKALEVLVRALDHDEVGDTPAQDALVLAGRKATALLLGVLAAPPSERAGMGAAEALGMLQAVEAREPLLAALRRGAIPAPAVLRALRALRDPGAIPAVLELLEDRSVAVRAEARRTLSVLLDRKTIQGQAVDPLAAALNNGKLPPGERAQLVRLLGATGSPRAAKIVAPLVASPTLRLAAIEALGLLGSASETGPLLLALDSEEAMVRARAGAALALVGGEAEVPMLLERLTLAQQQDRGALATALAGALGRVTSLHLLERVGALLPTLEGATRDALLEGLGRSTSPEALRILYKVAISPEAADRRKAAEALGGHSEGRETLRRLLADPDAGVRANAAWSLGSFGGSEDLEALSKLAVDPSVAVAANALVSTGRIAGRLGALDSAKSLLCSALQDGRPSVRAGALAGLHAAGIRCDRGGDLERKLLVLDPSPIVRAAAAHLLLGVASSQPEQDRRALSRCRREDPYGSVARRCSGGSELTGPGEPVVVLVVPDGKSTPAPEAPFALRFADRWVRHGVTDRRGAIFEAEAPPGPLSLEVPAMLIR
ncbi:MAG: HEAT repeat domain-containing protein [Myxococcales bacterium]|nr:HEAT repeat domain-containing protein [Polyangiaceae bacterium]MDW8249441.1 HEAT repeat domain-containing protein [Myxococcales bacterium]